MLYRKITKRIEEYLSSGSDRMLLIDGARQIGKSYIIRWVGQKMFANYIEINMEEDKLGDRIFAEAKTTDDFYLALSVVAGEKMKSPYPIGVDLWGVLRDSWSTPTRRDSYCSLRYRYQ